MAQSNHERVGRALEILNTGLTPFVEREMLAKYGERWRYEAARSLREQHLSSDGGPHLDTQGLLLILWDQWNTVFKNVLGHAERSLVSELRETRNKWAHQEALSTDDAYRALDSMQRLLTAISAAPQAHEIDRQKQELLRIRFDDQLRNETRKIAISPIEGRPLVGLRPWREIITPQPDVASGSYKQAEFAADLVQVYYGEGSDEYRVPHDFFQRTFLTSGLRRLLSGALQRLSGTGGDPVIELQTNFGGGKTHSMLALYHLFCGMPPAGLPGLEPVFVDASIDKIPPAKRAVIVGNKISPGSPSRKPDGTVIKTLWGELAWQLGGKEGFAMVKADDERATSPGDTLRLLFNKYAPCLILIDEWVAYARQLHDAPDIPGGSFETHFTFAQTLSEAAKAAKGTLLVVSIPASEGGGVSPGGSEIADVEVGGERGRSALERLKNAIGRVESAWRPASADEGFEIVRRRLFEQITDTQLFVARDATAKAFIELYRGQSQEFPPECRAGDYERRLKLAYPIHPEVFERLYQDWSSLVKFQRTRGVLRLMAAVIHALWEKQDRNPLILPGNIPIDDPRVQFELTRYLSDNWVPVIEKDVDGPSSLPLRLDGEIPNLGKFAACRRVARTIYLGSAPLTTAANRGLEDRRVKLGCVMPGESPAVFGDALRRLAAAATYLYQDGPRYWYSTQPTVTKLAEDRAAQPKRDSDKVVQELDGRLRADLRRMGDFPRVQPMPGSSADVPDELEARLVVLSVDHAYSKEADNEALTAAKAMLGMRGNTPRLFQNTLVFLAIDQIRLQDLDEAVRRYLAWESIVADAESGALELTTHQITQAKEQKDTANGIVAARLPEAYQWLLVATQASPQNVREWKAFRLSGQDPLAVRVSKKLRNDELLVTVLAGSVLRMPLDRVPLWRGDHVTVKQLVEDFARYLYLPRLVDTKVLLDAIGDGLSLLT